MEIQVGNFLYLSAEVIKITGPAEVEIKLLYDCVVLAVF